MRFGIDWDAQPLGEVHDTELARRLGVSEVAVGKQRRKRGIPVYGSGMKGGCRVPGQRAGIDWDKQPLGKVSDKELALKLDVDPSSVRAARLVRTPGYKPKPKKPKPPPPVVVVVKQDSSRWYHGHKCPVCFEVEQCCRDECEIDGDSVTSDGTVLGVYVTCSKCLEELSKETKGTVTYVRDTWPSVGR